MHDRDRKGAPGNEQPSRKAQGTELQNLKANEAYEPGFGKYTLTESELRAGEVNQREEKLFAGSKPGSYSNPAGKKAGQQQRQPGGGASPKQQNGPGVSHDAKAAGSRDEDRKMREDNTNMHNNW